MAQSRFGIWRQLPQVVMLTLSIAVSAHAASIVVYNAQHEQVMNMLAKDFEQQTGIGVKIRNGEGPWNPLQPCGVDAETIAAVEVPPGSPLRDAPVVLVVCVDLAVVAAFDQLIAEGYVGGRIGSGARFSRM